MIVVIQTIATEVGNVDILPAIVIEIANADALSPSFIGLTRLVGDFRKGPVAVVVIESGARRLRFASQRIQCRAIDQIDVQPPVIVVVEKCATGSGSLNQIILSRASRKMAKAGETGGAGHVREAHTSCGVD